MTKPQKYFDYGGAMRSFMPAFFALLLFFGASPISSAYALKKAEAVCKPEEQECVGKPCDATSIGLTRVDNGEENIIACLRDSNSASNYSWKPMNGGTSAFHIETEQVTCAAVQVNEGSPTDAGCTATCPEGTAVTGGGYLWGSIFSDAGRYLRQVGNGYRCLINVSSCSSGTISTGCGSGCTATCAKIVMGKAAR